MDSPLVKPKTFSAAWPRTLLDGLAVPVILFALAFGLRSVKIVENALWFDELYGYLLAQNGVRAILQNSFSDPHPPLYYLLQWAASGFGAWQSEWALRWLSVISGSLSVSLVYLLARRFTSLIPAVLSAGLLLFSPTHLYYSQEGRSFAFVILLACLSTWALLELDDGAEQKRLWAGLAGVTLVALYTSYSYFLVAGIQALYLFWKHPRSRLMWICVGAVVGISLPLLPWLVRSLVRTNTLTAIPQPLTLLRMAQGLFGGEPVRYGFGPSHIWLPVGMAILAAAGVFSLSLPGKRRLGGFYLVFQAGLPLALFFGAAGPIFDLHLPLHESKQFIVLLPALHVLAAAGAGWLWENRGSFFQRMLQRAALIGLAGIMIGASLFGIARYWSVPKSPEGILVLGVRDQVHAQDGVITLHHSLEAAASFYLRDSRVYYNPAADVTPIRFPDAPQFLPGTDHLDWTDLAQVRQHPRLWLLTHDSTSDELIEKISSGCVLEAKHDQPPFYVYLLSGCSQ